MRILCTIVATLAIAATAASGLAPAAANDALDFWRQDYQRSQADRQRSHQRPPEASSPRLQLTIRPSGRDAGPDRDDDDFAGPAERGARGGARILCVRTCDGFYFPLSVPGGDERESCRDLCPGAPMEVYRQPSGTDDMAAAVSPSGRRYASLPAAFLYRKQIKSGCGCDRKRVGAFAALRRDDTLRAGDIVMTEKGVHIFHGARRFPYREADFLPLAKAHGLPKSLSSFLSLIDRPFRQSELKESLGAPVKTALLTAR